MQVFILSDTILVIFWYIFNYIFTPPWWRDGIGGLLAKAEHAGPQGGGSAPTSFASAEEEKADGGEE